MKRFHITWFEAEGDLISKGENFEANSPVDALLIFNSNYPNAIFISCISSEAIQNKYGLQQAVQHTD